MKKKQWSWEKIRHETRQRMWKKKDSEKWEIKYKQKKMVRKKAKREKITKDSEKWEKKYKQKNDEKESETRKKQKILRLVKKREKK